MKTRESVVREIVERLTESGEMHPDIIRKGFSDVFENIKDILDAKKIFTGGHNRSHTYIHDGYCYGCRKKLTQEQLEEVFGYNIAIDEAIGVLDDFIGK